MARRREAWVVPRWSPQLKHDSDSTFAGGISRILGLDRHSKAQDFLPAKWVDADGLGPRPCGAAASLTVPLCVDRQVGHAHFNAVAVEPGLASIAPASIESAREPNLLQHQWSRDSSHQL
eukprot:3870332-Rhodomonas_salina.2